MDSPPEFCFCGRKTVESHDFWFCSTKCARQDSLRSLGNPECHYRTVVRDAYVRAGVPGPQPRRMASAVHLHPGPSDRHGFENTPPPFIPPANLPQQYAALARLAGLEENPFPFPTHSAKELATTKATTGEFVPERRDRSRRQGFQNIPWDPPPVTRPADHAVQQINLRAVPFSEGVPARPLRRAPSSIDVLKNNPKESPVSALLNFGRSQKSKKVENPERVFGYPANTMDLAARKEARKGRFF